jgi:hypothetical protein
MPIRQLASVVVAPKPSSEPSRLTRGPVLRVQREQAPSPKPKRVVAARTVCPSPEVAEVAPGVVVISWDRMCPSPKPSPCRAVGPSEVPERPGLVLVVAEGQDRLGIEAPDQARCLPLGTARMSRTGDVSGGGDRSTGGVGLREPRFPAEADDDDCGDNGRGYGEEAVGGFHWPTRYPGSQTPFSERSPGDSCRVPGGARDRTVR